MKDWQNNVQVQSNILEKRGSVAKKFKEELLSSSYHQLTVAIVPVSLSGAANGPSWVPNVSRYSNKNVPRLFGYKIIQLFLSFAMPLIYSTVLKVKQLLLKLDSCECKTTPVHTKHSTGYLAIASKVRAVRSMMKCMIDIAVHLCMDTYT